MFNAIAGIGIGQALGLIEQEKRRKEKAEKISRNKVRIKAANTDRAQTNRAPYLITKTNTQYLRLIDYVEELRQQAKWDAEKCANQ